MISQGGTTRDSYIAEVESKQTFKQFDICLNFRYRCSVLSLFHFTIEAVVWLSYCEKKSLVFVWLPQDIRTRSWSSMAIIVANAHLLRNSHESFGPQDNSKVDSWWRFFILIPWVDLSIKLLLILPCVDRAAAVAVWLPSLRKVI